MSAVPSARHLARRIRSTEALLALGVLVAVLVLGFRLVAPEALPLASLGRRFVALQLLVLAAVPLLPGIWGLRRAERQCRALGRAAEGLAQECRIAVQTAGGVAAFFAWPMALSIVL